MVGGRTLWSLGGLAATMPSLAAASPCPTCVWHSRCPLTCSLLGPLLPTLLLLSWAVPSVHILQQNTGSWGEWGGQSHFTQTDNFSDYQPAEGHGFEGGRGRGGEGRRGAKGGSSLHLTLIMQTHIHSSVRNQLSTGTNYRPVHMQH